MKLVTSFGFRRKKLSPEGNAHLLSGHPAGVAWPKPERRDGRATDALIAGLGVALGLVCAMLPWYVFFNQEEFGIRALDLERASGDIPLELTYKQPPVRAPFSASEIPTMAFDFLPTGTLPDHRGRRSASPDEQPFPADLIDFKLVHVANGRAMIQDEDGLWVVQRGSQLPDASKVASIEKRDGQWVLVTTLDEVIEIER